MLTDSQKAELQRKGNTLFNEGRYFDAGRIFTAIGYKSGLIRLGDFFYFEKEMPLVAYGFYRSANHKAMLDKIGDGFVFALKCLLSDETSPSPLKKTQATEAETFKVRSANAPDAGAVTEKNAVGESRENKIERAVSMLKRLSS